MVTDELLAAQRIRPVPRAFKAWGGESMKE
jgi:hypothetical protein